MSFSVNVTLTWDQFSEVVELVSKGVSLLQEMQQDVEEIRTLSRTINTKVDKIVMTNAELKQFLLDVDTKTSATAEVVTKMGDTANTIKAKLDALIAAANQPQAVPADIADLATKILPEVASLSTSASGVSDFLLGVAKDGEPVIPPPPPPPPPPTV